MIKAKRGWWAVFIAAILNLVIASSASPAYVSAHDEATASPQGITQERVEPTTARLVDTKLKACQKRENAINNIMSRLADRGTKQLDLFTKISERTQAFYASKGKTLSNYDTLLADVTAKKTAAQTAVATVKSASTEFKCDGTNPKGTMSTFKSALKLEIEALKAYKTSVKNLIVGVKSVQGTTTSAGNNNGGQQ